jgi:hypothetical protein
VDEDLRNALTAIMTADKQLETVKKLAATKIEEATGQLNDAMLAFVNLAASKAKPAGFVG